MFTEDGFDIRVVFEEANRISEELGNTPVRQLARKIIKEEKDYLYSEQKSGQRKKNIKGFIEEARKSGHFSVSKDA